MVYGGGDAGAFAAAADDVDVAAGVLAVAGVGACGEELGAAAAALTGVVVLAGLEPLLTAGAALSELAATAADLGVGAAAVAAAAADAFALTGGMAAAYVPDGTENKRLALPSTQATWRAVRLAFRRVVRVLCERGAHVEYSAFTTVFSTARCALEAACRALPARYTR